MKKTYVSPEVELLCMVSREQLTATEFDFDDLLGNGGGVIGDSKIDIDVPVN